MMMVGGEEEEEEEEEEGEGEGEGEEEEGEEGMFSSIKLSQKRLNSTIFFFFCVVFHILWFLGLCLGKKRSKREEKRREREGEKKKRKKKEREEREEGERRTKNSLMPI